MVIRKDWFLPKSILAAILIAMFTFVTPAYAIEEPDFLFEILCFCGSREGVDADSTGRIFISDPAAPRIHATDSSGNTLFFFGTRGTGDGQFMVPNNIAIDSQDRVVITDLILSRIQVFDSNGNFLFKFGVPSPIKAGITTDSNNRIIASDVTNSQILVYDSVGNSLFSFPVNRPNAVVTDSQDRIIVSVNHQVLVYDSAGNFLFNFGSPGSGDGQLSSPLGLAVDSFDNIIVADENNNRIAVFDSAGTFLLNFGSSGSGPGQFDEPNGVAVTLNDRILVMDADNSRVQVFGEFTPQETIAEILTIIDELDLSSTENESLGAPLNTAIEHLDDGVDPNDSSVCGQLNAFLAQINAKEAQGILSPEDAAALRFYAIQTLIDLGC